MHRRCGDGQLATVDRLAIGLPGRDDCADANQSIDQTNHASCNGGISRIDEPIGSIADLRESDQGS